MRFVLLQHKMPAAAEKDSHLDLMLESDDGLLTWSIVKFPADGEEVVASELPVHRLAYLDYEGPVSNNRGEVSRVDRGVFEIQLATDDEVVVQLQGQTCKGTARLVRVDGKSWKLTCVAS